MADYDIRAIFEQMELDLIASMRRNLSRHQKWENKEGINWTMWQAEQLKTLENFKKSNEKLFKDKFSIVNNEIAEFLEETYKVSGFEQEKAILEQLAKGNKMDWKNEQGLEGAFFSLNRDKMNALIKATVDDMKTAETAMLRMVNDQYRKTIYKAQVMANSGAFTLKQSIDAATKDFLKAGINCIQYKDGRRVNISSYAEMALRTANKRAMLVSEGDIRKAYGIHTVRISKYGQCSETCLPWQGKIYVDDVYSGGTKEEAKEKNLKLISEAMVGGLFHPNCRHRSTTYFYDLEKALENNDGDVENPIEEQEHRKNQLHIQQQKRLEEGSLDSKNIAEAKQRKEMWIEKDRELGYFKQNDKIHIFTDDISIRRIGTNDVDIGYISSYDYRRKFNQLTSSTKVNESIRNQASSILTKYKGTDTEKLVIIDGDTGAIVFEKTGEKNALSVDLSIEEVEFIRNYQGNKIAIHNHPTNILPTGGDFGSAGYRKYSFGLVITHDGCVYYYKPGKFIFNSALMDKRIDKYLSQPYNMSVQDAHVKVLDEFREEYGITWKELKKEKD